MVNDQLGRRIQSTSGQTYRNSHAMTTDAAYRFESSAKYLRNVALIVTEANALMGDSSTQDIPLSTTDRPVFDCLDISSLYIRNADAGSNTTVKIFGITI
jgi:hypothetical protein